ncbi:MAG: enoyl-CoA hydratase/isomerase family protein [Acidobacteriota bacterium]
MIEITRTGRVLQVALNRPEKRNALNAELCSALVTAFDEAEADGDVGAILMRGNGPAFCAGMDLREAVDTESGQLAGIHERLFTTIQRARKPIVAAVQGPALAGGTGLTANAHIVVAAPDARFGLTEIRIGLWPVLIFRACVLAMGERRATELSLTGRIFPAPEGLRYGLVTEVAEDPLARAMEIAAGVSEYSAFAMRGGLDYVQRIRGLDWEEAGEAGKRLRDQLMNHEDFAKGVRAFLEKRVP